MMKNKTYVFNNPVETGLRSLIILDAAYPKSLDLQKLIYFDYMTVHTGDMPAGPESIHPSIPNRSGELLVRRKLIENGIEYFVRKKFIDKIFNENGIEYLLNENATMFLDMLDEVYILNLKGKAKWVIETYLDWNSIELDKYIKNNLDKWGGEFMYCNLGDIYYE
jgi:hypothetical protein